MNIQIFRAFQLIAFLIQHVRARLVSPIDIFLAARALVCHIGQAFFIARDVAIADIVVRIRAGRLTGQFTLVHIVGGIALFCSALGFSFLFICNDLNTTVCACIIDIAVFDMVEAQLKVDAIGELSPIVVTGLLPEPARPVRSVICGHLHIHKAGNLVALVTVGVFIRVIRSAVHIQPVPLAHKVQVDGLGFIVCLKIRFRGQGA